MKKFVFLVLSSITVFSLFVPPPALAAAGETFIIAATSSAGGTISPSGNVSVAAGANQTFTFTPDTSHTVGGIMVDMEFVNPQPSYTFTNVSANHTINAIFSVQQLVTPPPDLNPLNQSAIPEPPNLYQYVTNKQMAIKLGKAFYWDMQAGSDGMTACATCHFVAGADNRKKNTVNPGTRAGDTTFQVVAGPNQTIQPTDFPFHERANAGHLQSDPVTRNYNDVVGSQGIRKYDFVGVTPGSAVDNMVPVFDPVFNLAPSENDSAKNVRQVTARNTPSVINAIFNFTNFWDGRANFVFNGENTYGAADQDAGVWVNDPVDGLVKKPVRLIFASLASQALGPPLDSVEMSAAGRTFPELGRKMLSLTPLGKQLVSHDDSVLGGLSNSRLRPDGVVIYAPGLHDSYSQLIQQSFHDFLWNSAQPVTINVRGQDMQFTQMEANFSFFWGLSIQLYLATMVSDQTPYDRWLGGDKSALTEQQKMGFALFNGVGKCNLCHTGIELTAASVAASGYVIDDIHTLIELMFVADGNQVIYDNGFNNTAVTPTTDDIGRGGTSPYINPLTGQPYPLSFSTRAELRAKGLLPFSTPILPPGIPTNQPVNANGAFKVPGLRNVELTAPYFHNGSIANLDDVIDLYIRGGNFPMENIHDLDADVAGGLSQVLNNEVMEHAVIEYMKSLTDGRVIAEAAPFDHPELFVPEGAPEILRRIPGTDENGTPIPALPITINSVTSPTNVTAQTVSGMVGVGLVPVITVNTAATIGTVTVNGTAWGVEITSLVEGSNVITASVTDNSSVVTSLTATIIVDTTPPALTVNPVTSPTTLLSQTISGTVESGAVVKVSVNGGQSVLAVSNGTSWSFNASLALGSNTISVTATDGAGNASVLPMVEIVRQSLATPSSFNVSLSSGWSLFSTPVVLDTGAGRLDQIFDNTSIAKIEAVVKWDGSQWLLLGAADRLLPLEAVFVKVSANTTVTAVLTPSTDLSAPPSRQLVAGLNLVGPAPSFVNGGFQAQPLNTSLISVAQAPGGFSGYTIVISPAYNQEGWEYIIGGQVHDLLPFKGYWVIMDNPDTLFGFSTTPLSQ